MYYKKDITLFLKTHNLTNDACNASSMNCLTATLGLK